MKNVDWKSINRAPEGAKKKQESKSANEKQELSWTRVVIEIIVKILTLGFYHIEKHKRK
jgi:hypothetical protein